MLVRVSSTIVSILFVFAVNAQVQGLLVFSDSDLVKECYSSKLSLDTLSVHANFSRCIASLHGEGYLEARIDSISISTTQLMAYGHLGKMYQWARIAADSVSQRWLQRAGVKPSRFLDKPLSPKLVGDLGNQVTTFLEDNGFPFASVTHSELQIHDNHFHSNLSINPGPLIRLDTLYLMGDAKISRGFIEQYLGFSRDAMYSESQLRAYDSKLQALPFVTSIRPVEVEFTPGRARVYTYLTNQQASQFSGILGFSSKPDENPRLRFTGDLNLQLLNVFGRGESNSLQWQAFDQGTQRLKVSSEWHYLFGSSIGVSSHFNLFRRDTSYINVNPKVSFNFPFSSGVVSLGFDYRSSSATSLANGIGNTSTFLYTAALTIGQPLDLVLPIKGYRAGATFAVGQRKEGEGVNSSNGSSVVGEISVDIVGYHPIYNDWLVLKAAMHGQVLNRISSDALGAFYENELYRIGGFGSLRGFNQETIITPAYSIAQAELQFRVERSLNVFLFYDQGLLSIMDQDVSTIQSPYGTGFGFQLASAGGVFSMSYALGNGMGETLNFRNAKLHIGFTARF